MGRWFEPFILLLVWGTILLILLNHIGETTQLGGAATNFIGGTTGALKSFAS